MTGYMFLLISHAYRVRDFELKNGRVIALVRKNELILSREINKDLGNVRFIHHKVNDLVTGSTT